MNPRSVLIALIFALLPVPALLHAAPAQSAQCPADSELAKLIASSDVVMLGRMDVPKTRLTKEAQKKSPEYVEIPLQVDSLLKGRRFTNPVVSVYPKDAPYRPSNKAILGMANKPAILFLTQGEEASARLYFAGYSSDALQPFTDASLEAVRKELSRQAQIIHSWKMDSRLPYFAKVKKLVARLGHVSDDEQQHIFDQIEALGEAGAPAIIAQMDVRRALRTQSISLTNSSPDAFESIRHYRPNLVVDGLAAVLNQITGESFGLIYSGGSNRVRDATVEGWRIYAADLACKEKQ